MYCWYDLVSSPDPSEARVSARGEEGSGENRQVLVTSARMWEGSGNEARYDCGVFVSRTSTLCSIHTVHSFPQTQIAELSLHVGGKYSHIESTEKVEHFLSGR